VSGGESSSIQELNVVDEERDLGVIIQSTLKCEEQCAKVVKSANAMLGVIKRIFICEMKLFSLYIKH